MQNPRQENLRQENPNGIDGTKIMRQEDFEFHFPAPKFSCLSLFIFLSLIFLSSSDQIPNCWLDR
ncbi:MAG: hypothetical protein C5B50_18685 [Verrucomicrobia bacterium]|nr:MAG: hypothetical protein C5B50_18685 [Verrucomicrobiota bacterium]